MHLSVRTAPEDFSLGDLLDRILDKGIVLEPWARVILRMVDFCDVENRITVAPERRRKMFIVPTRKRKR
jgi:hypothetical protein